MTIEILSMILIGLGCVAIATWLGQQSWKLYRWIKMDLYWRRDRKNSLIERVAYQRGQQNPV